MKKLLLGTILLGLVIVFPIPSMAGVNINVGINLPPIGFSGPPAVVAMPEANGVYFVPGIAVDLFFWNGWWWRPWEGRWYRSHYYDRGWAYYDSVPHFYYDVDPHWREYYRNHNWNGHRWDYKPVPYRDHKQNWEGWDNNRYWEKNRKWDMQGYTPQSETQREDLRHQRHKEYQQKNEQERQQQQHSQGGAHHEEGHGHD